MLPLQKRAEKVRSLRRLLIDLTLVVAGLLMAAGSFSTPSASAGCERVQFHPCVYEVWDTYCGYSCSCSGATACCYQETGACVDTGRYGYAQLCGGACNANWEAGI